MAKDWIITSEKDSKHIVQVMRLSDGKRFTLGDKTFHGPIRYLGIRGDGIYAAFESGDAACDININDIKPSLPDQDPCDESHTDVMCRERAAGFLSWYMYSDWQYNDKNWYINPVTNKTVNGQDLYEIFKKECEL